MKKTISVILSVVIMLSVLTSGIVTVQATASVIENALQWAIGIANDDSHGYSQSSRWGPDYDCSSFVISALKSVGLDVGGATYTGNMRSNLTTHDFTWIPWSQISSSANLQRGDILLYHNFSNNDGHTEFYLGNNQNVGAHSNRGYPQTGDQTGTEVSVSGYYYHPWDGVLRYNGGNNPTGCLDGLVGGTGTVTVSGWAFDRDDMSASLNIHVYIGGQAGDSNAEGIGWITANTYRPDVDNVYGCGGYHGYDVTIQTTKTGTQAVYVYAINVGSGENVLIGSGTVNITADTEKPNIESAYLSRVTADSYRVCVIPKDNVGIKVVRVATWTKSDQSDLIWHDCEFNGNGTYFIDINRSDYFSGATVYQNHIYVYDLAGNSVGIPKEMVYETNPPQISNITISQVSKSGFRINCKVSDDTGISSIKFPTWTSYNGQDDIIWYDGIVKNGTATCYVKANEHNNETGPYTIHIYLYDTYGNLSTAIINGIELKDEPTEVSSVEYKGKIYKVFNSGFGWNNAKLWCESQGGHLATINSEEEWEIVKKALNDFNGAKCWLGAENKSGSWKWVTGEELSFTKWAQNQPDCCGNNEFYLGTFGNDSLESLNCCLWNDYAESGVEVGGFVCEFEYTCGDVNNDGSINITDTTAIQKHIASINTLDENALIRADVNSDSSVDIKDATLIQQYSAGLIDKF